MLERFSQTLRDTVKNSTAAAKARRKSVKLSVEALEDRTVPAMVAAFNFDAGAGTALADLSGNNNNGTISNATWSNTGKYNKSLLFNGTTARVNIADAASLRLTTGMTLEAWVRPTTVSNLWRDVLAKGSSDYTISGTTTNSSKPAAALTAGGSAARVFGNPKLSANVWTHMAVTYDGSTLRMYLNGQLVSTAAKTGNMQVTANQLQIGANSLLNRYFKGYIDDVRIYNTPLTQTQIQTDMNTPVGTDTTAPTVSVTAPANGATVASTVSVTANATDNVGVAGVQFFLDGVALGAEDTSAPYGVSWNTATTSNGTHSLTARARDAAGNTKNSTAVLVNVNNSDTAPPSVNLTAPANGATVSSSITVSANATDNVGVAGVQFFLDGTALGTEDTAAPFAISWNTTTATNGSHTLTARARDAAGNMTTSAAVQVNVNNSDTSAPSVSVTAPANGATVANTISVTANASDNVGVVGVQFFLDGTALGAEDTTSPYAISWNTTTVANGSHTLTARARDAAGNATTSSAVQVTVNNSDTSAPSVSITAPANGATVANTINVTANASDNVGVAGVQFFLDGNALGAEDTTSPYSVSWNTTTATNGSHTLTAKARDAAGNTTTSTAVQVTVNNDTTAPTVSITAPSNGATVSNSISVTATASDNVGVAGVQFYLDGTALGTEDTTSPYSVSWNTTTASNGSHTLTAKARDAAGNTTTSTAVQVTVNNSGSTITVSNVTELVTAVNNLQSGQTIVMNPGTYQLSDTLWFPQNKTNITLRGSTTNRDSVIIRGNGMTGSIGFGIWTGNVQNVTFSDFTLRDFSQHGIILNGGTESPTIRNVRIVDIGDQFVKANPDGAGGGVDNGLVENSLFEFTSQANDTYTNGVDVLTGSNWVIRNNTFRNFKISSGLVGPALLMWQKCVNTTVEGNLFTNNQVDIALGLDVTVPNDHSGGIISNNIISKTSVPGEDVGIYVVNSPNTQVLNNTVINSGNYPNAIEYRGTAATGVVIRNNLTNAAITARDGATGTVNTNVTNAQASWFVNAAASNLHLVSTATAAIDKGATLTNVVSDYDGQARPSGSAYDVGADEYVNSGDGAPPSASITAPGNGTTVSGTVNVAANATDNVGVVGVQFFLDGAALGAEDTSSPYSISWNTLAATNGTHTLTAKARDAAGNSATSSAVQVTVSNESDTTPPSVNITAPTNGATVSSTVTVSASASDNVGVSGVQFFLDGNALGSEDTTAPYSVSWNSTTTGNGSHTLTAKARDAAGNTTTSTAVQVTVNNSDTSPPTVSITSPASGATVSNSVTVSANASDNVGVSGVQFFVDGTSLGAEDTSSPYSIAWNTVSAPNGSHTLTAKARDAAGNTTTSTAVQVTVNNSGSGSAYIITPYDKIPNFGLNPTIVSTTSGNWSNPATWSLGRIPTANDVVSIPNGKTVTFDVTMANTDAIKSLAIQAGGKLAFRTDISTMLYVSNFLVMEGGELEVGTAAVPVSANVTASIIFPNKAIDTTADPSQYGNGLVALGKVTMFGAVKDSFVRLATEPKAGDTTLTLSQAAVGWRVGDKLELPDSKQWAIESGPYVPEYETATISAISADGKTITLAAALQFNHPGARDGDGVLGFLPHVGNRTRNVVVRSESAAGNRGHAMFTYHADVDIRYATFGGLGRTTIDPIDNTTYNSSGGVTHVGTNQDGRHPVDFGNLVGPSTTPANGYQYTFIGNAVFCPMPDIRFKWGITINNSHYGLIQDNFVFNWAGAGIVTQQGNESFNVISHNFVLKGRGEGDRAGSGKPGDEGSAFWFRGPNNYVVNNVGANFLGDSPEAAYGFKYYMVYLGNIRVPNFKGADTSVSGQYTTKNGNGMPLLQFEGNQAYGVENGLTIWWLNAIDTVPQSGGTSIVKNFTAWNTSRYGFYGYPMADVVFDGYTVWGDKSVLSNPYEFPTGMWFGDYMTKNVTLRNANVQGLRTGFIDPYFGGSTTTIENSYFRNTVDIDVTNLGAPGSDPDGANRQAKSLIIRNVRFGSTSGWNQGGKSPFNILMDYDQHNGSANLIRSDTVYVYDYNGVTGDNFRTFYNQQAASFVVPKSSGNLVAAPVAGLTNQQLWDQYGLAFAGEVATNSTIRPDIGGLVRPL